MVTQGNARAILLHSFRFGLPIFHAYENLLESEGENAPCQRTCYTWYQLFSSGDYNLSDEPRSGAPLVHDRKAVLDVVDSNSKAGVRRVAAETDASRETVWGIFHGSRKKPKRPSLVPHELTDA